MGLVRGLAWRLAALSAVLLVVAGCTVPAAYQPREGDRGTGFSELQLASNRWRVTFTGNSATKRDAVENYLLLRAAEVSVKAGYHWFEFDSRDTEAQTTYRSTVWPGLPRRGWYRGVGMWGDDEVTSRPVTAYEAYAEIVLLSAEQAKGEARALNTEDVIAHIGKLARPSQP